MEFCKAFNAATDSLEKNMPIPVVITVFSDKSFSFITKTPPVSFYLKKAINEFGAKINHRLYAIHDGPPLCPKPATDVIMKRKAGS